jgi:hypothetical protein
MAKQLDPKSVQFEESEPKSQRSWESEEARRARQAKLARDLEWEAIRRRRAILRAAIGIPLCLIVATAAILLGLDKKALVHLHPRQHIHDQASCRNAEGTSLEAQRAMLPSDGEGARA